MEQLSSLLRQISNNHPNIGELKQAVRDMKSIIRSTRDVDLQCPHPGCMHCRLNKADERAEEFLNSPPRHCRW